ncbi:nuclear pore complex protein Nup98-Nup96 [Eurytemora carolleeae]|uniref:nuclear pore complex protein Nup98-Nup96 n=1 Tax=Eurytemora carolleeae TaxID=1294199 RepID=UPI000C791A0D|nr:nuclear pore complex protein Nup98-Nup96 [Eurytemora carolleeae]|eukprot:XP_023336271.1 nuclear pore complex protein Nup98-Nup96-like [Eurytemora affinis]
MFGQSAFGANTGGGFGANTSFGAAPNTSMFGGTPSTFGAAQQNKPAFGAGGSAFGNTGGGLFGSSSVPAAGTGGGLFGSGGTTATSTFGSTTGAFGQPSNAFGGTAGGFGQPAQQSGGLFGSTATTQAGGLFSGQPSTTFGATGSSFGGGSTFGFGSTNTNSNQQPGTAHVKFAPMQGSDTMMKSGVQTSIATRHQCITCMKEYENKSMEELRCEDYMAGRKGTAGGGAAAGGLFGSTQPAAGGGLFGSQPASSSGGLFGQQQKPLFGTSGFGGTGTAAAAPAFGSGGFGQQTTQAGGLFGAKPFGATTTSTTGFGGFGAQQPAQSGGLFGAQSKPFGSVAPQPAGGLFGAAPTTGFGASTGTSFTGFGQPAQPAAQPSIGLFGAQNQAKPAFGGFGATPASSTPAFGGFGATSTSQSGGLFGSTAAKPGFGGFGAATTSQPSTGFGGFGAASTGGGGLFGSNQAKPAFSFGGTSTAGASTGFGGFGSSTATGGGLFSGAAKPGGLFGAPTTGFGTGTTGFGAGTTGFGTSTGTSAFGSGGLNFGGQTAINQAPAPQPQSSAVQQQLLMALATSPFGENPLFKPVAETGKAAELLKPGGLTAPAAQKLLAAGQYKVSPHRNIKVRTKAVDSTKSSMFDGLEDDLSTTGEMFSPRSSVKKLILRPKRTDNVNNSVLSSLGDDPSLEKSLTVPLDETRPKKTEIPTRSDPDLSIQVDDSFAALNTRKKLVQQMDEEVMDKSGLNTSQNSAESDKDEEVCSHPGGITLRRSGYYTIPPLAEIRPDKDGNCLVEGFTIGREGYGNIHYPGVTNIAGLNLDEIVFFRHKEVIVYPDDQNKPNLGDGLNKKAQITLDKVWPTDKADSSIIKSSERLRAMNYEDKLVRASTRLGARFIEYRPETGSWVFRVDHFSKYGLDESDEEDGVGVQGVQGVPGVDNKKKMKTLHLEKRTISLDVKTDSSRIKLNTEVLDNQRAVEITESDGVSSDQEQDVEMNEVDGNINARRTLLRSALFSECLEDGEALDIPTPKPIILQQRNPTSNLSQARPRLIEEIATSVLMPNKGLGGSFLGETSLNVSLLRSNYSTQSQSINLNRSSQLENSQLKNTMNRLPSYTLTGGYEKFPQLASAQIAQQQPAVITPQYTDTDLPLSNSYLSQRFQQIADSGLFHNKRFRVGFLGGLDHVENPGSGYLNLVSVEQSQLKPWQLTSLESWLQVCLENSECCVDDNGPFYSPSESINNLYTHHQEATRQLEECNDDESRKQLEETRHTWNLIHALWGQLCDLEDSMMDLDQATGRLEGHVETIERRNRFSAWLEAGVEEASRRDKVSAREKKNYLGRVRALLTGGRVEDACDALQSKGDHRSALLVAQMGGGGVSSKLVQQQIDRWVEVKADRYIAAERIELMSLVAGQPIQLGTMETLNTCSNLDWQRSMAVHLWYLTHPVSSISDTLEVYEAAWRGTQPYSSRPEPAYSEEPQGNIDGEDGGKALDLKYHLIKLYSDRSHKLESVLAPTTHTANQLDFSSSWFIYRVLCSLGYRSSGSLTNDRLCSEFSSQLEYLGYWDWAIFVLLHIKDPVLRKSSVDAILERNVKLEDGGREEWLMDTLGVPVTWVARARAVLARTQGKHTQLTEQLIKAKDWNEAHKLIIAEIAPSALLSQNYSQLEDFLTSLQDAADAQKINGWASEGKVYLDFIRADTAVNKLRQTRDIENLGYELERLKPVVTGLCRTIANLPVNNSKQRLSQSEIAKKVAHFMRAVYSFESSRGDGAASTARQLAESLSMLPLPEDYALQELRTLTRSYLAEIMDQ